MYRGSREEERKKKKISQKRNKRTALCHEGTRNKTK
jgi:hypothetical protein